MAKIKVKNPVVEMDGDEMTRIIWQWIREHLILPYLEIDLKYYDVSIKKRDETNPNMVDGPLLPEPIICSNVPRVVHHWSKPVVVARHGFADQYRATDFQFPSAGTLKVSWTPDNGDAPIEREIVKAPGAGVVLGMFNLDESISGFARACFNYALDRHYPVYLSTKNTILKVYDGRFK